MFHGDHILRHNILWMPSLTPGLKENVMPSLLLA